MGRRLALALAVTAVLVSGCGSASTQIPESASLAPADAVVFAMVTTDDTSSQWQKAERVLERIPGARGGLVNAIEQGLSEEGLDWKVDIAPALGDEVVVVVTAELRPVVLLQPRSVEKLDALLETSGEEIVRGEVEGHVALAEKDADLADYRAALERGTIEGDESFAAGLDALPDESLGLVWVDMAALTDELSSLVEQATQENVDFGIDWLSAALSAEDEGILVAVGARTPGAGDTHYEPTLFRRVPADAVVAISFGGTQGTLDRLQGQVDVDEFSKAIEELTGVSLDGLVDALSGEGVFYVRPAAELPDVTLALAPPDPQKTWSTVDRLVRKLATEMQATVSTTIENGLEVSMLDIEGVMIRYARLDADTIVVTTSEVALTSLAGGGGAKLVDSEGYRRAAQDVGLEERTKGFVYVDVDGLLPLIESLAGESVPAELREGFEAVDSLIFQTSGDGDTTRVTGFVRVP
jgi:DNA-binding transcriptional ArsR family regulator